MPSSNTSNLPETLVSLPWKLLGVPPAGHTLVKVLGTVGHARSNAEPLAQGSGSHINKRQPWGWVTLQVGVDFSQFEQIFSWEETSLSPCSIQNWSSVTF